ncbi:hypothetical protein CIL05_12365 [Virgibacillus profundi]|uniref:Competence protein CoiA n=1 Tax=Virgibacillus profundi TaxID=2024555 RepID=A0A2A2IDH4_9BACI|nr:competence protein CoiA family protein [Virgibacillus profundi]PAV29185.1 hypothetical protein CIL05_12365 [Virgibacillus profundi]PXY53354.1 hypothetical protein CIT14_12490 [Virgibacillus profundi]
MLQAKLKEGKLVTLATFNRKEIEQMKQQKWKFYCPTCNHEVIMKAGSKMVPHFAHMSKIHCPSNEGGEGPYHEQGKLMLYQWLKSQNINVQLEAHLKEINQRPDLLLTINNKRIAMEYQCARTPAEQIKQRNEGYKRAGITPIWILGAKRFNRQTGNHFRLDQFTLQFIHQFSSGLPLTLFYFCPQTLQFIIIQDIYLTSTGQAIGKITSTKLNNISFPDVFIQNSFSPNQLNQLWKNEKRQFRLKTRKNLYGNELAWHQWLYLKGTHLEYLPSIIYLPVASGYLMKTPAWNWQSRLCLDVLDRLATGQTLSQRSIKYHLRKHIQQPRDFPLIPSEDNPIENYLQLLTHLNIVKKLSPSHYQKKNSLQFYKSIEESLQGDNDLMNALANHPDKIQA